MKTALVSFASLGSMTAISLVSTAIAQTTPQPNSAAISRDPFEIVVTAQRREERLQDVPISLAVVGGETLENRSVQNFEQLAPLVPNLIITKTPAANVIMLRGIGSAPGSPSLDQSVVMFIDGIYAGNARQFAAPFMDVERLEILRGPQGALVCRNTSAGAINIITRKPGKEFGGYVNANYNFKLNGPAIEGGLDIPASESLRFRVVGKYLDQEGYIYNSLVDEMQPDRREAMGRITGVYDNGGPLTITAKYDHADVRVHGTPVQLYVPERNEFRDYLKASALLDGPEYDNVKTNNAVLEVGYDFGGPTLVSISGYSGFTNKSLIDGDFFQGDFATADFDQKLDQYSQEIRLLSPQDQKIEYVIGGYYSWAKLHEERTTGVLFAPAASTVRFFNQKNEVYSAFGQLTFHMTDAFRVSGSLRYTHGTKRATYVRLGGVDAATDRVGALQDSFADRTKDSRVDPSLALQFDVQENTMLYATYGKGSKSSGFQGAISNATEDTFSYLPEKSTSYEIGTKMTFPGFGHLSLAGFYTEYKDLQVTAGIATPGALSASFFTGNAPKAKVMGAEAEFLARIGEFVTLEGSLAWMPTAKFVSFTAGPCYALQPSDGSLPGTCDVSGDRLGFAPKYSGSVTATAALPVSEGFILKISASPIFQGVSYRDFVNDPVSRQASYMKLDARIALATVDEKVEVALIGQNLTNKLVNAYGNTAGLANTFFDPGARVTVVEPPRVISIQGRVRF